MKTEMKDPGLHILIWIRAAFRKGFPSLQRTRSTPVFSNRRSKIVFLGFLVETFYLPLMTVFFCNQFNDFARYVNQFRFTPLEGFDRHDTLYQIGYHGLYLIDVILAMGGYAVPVRWLNNKIQSVEPTLLGWSVALICYPPFNNIGNAYLPYGHRREWEIIHAPWALDCLMVLTLLLAALYVGSTMMFGTRFSNLTHRGILTRGPYSWIRHPAYIAKNLSWWTENLPWMGNPMNFLFLAGWNGIYVLRAMTEERHLRQDPTYQAYCQKVKYRFIPGIY